MAYRISFKKSVSRDLKKLDKSEANKILERIVQELPLNADAAPVLKGKFKGLRKYRIGNYRVIFTIIEESIVITRIRHPKDAYK
ncbi:MAG: type II toxin-antitoxin system RelE/ParE family toxin [Candidatus Fermentibacteraceae bacterium]